MWDSTGESVNSAVPIMASPSPCGACKFLRRKCSSDCVFAPYFSSGDGDPARFAAIHKVFGASNASKLLLHVPAPSRCDAVVTIVYEAQARLQDPVYGCVAHIFALQNQVASLQAQLMQAKAQLAQRRVGVGPPKLGFDPHPLECSTSAQSWLDYGIGHCLDGPSVQEDNRYFAVEDWRKRRASRTSEQLEELQALALRMMGTGH